MTTDDWLRRLGKEYQGVSEQWIRNREKAGEEYANRHPDIGIACWKCGEHIWYIVSSDMRADYNSTSFQLKLGTWPNREMQKIYTDNADAFTWSAEKVLGYDDPTEDYTEDLELLLMEFLEEHPDALPMRQGKKR